ncbi:MAG: nucleotide pyrophosphohydrolase, partial [Gammaproteobacteria bacterium]
ASNAKHDPVLKEKTAQELADILMNLIRVADLMDINLSQAIVDKNVINNQRYPADKVRGSCKKYTQYLSG